MLHHLLHYSIIKKSVFSQELLRRQKIQTYEPCSSQKRFALIEYGTRIFPTQEKTNVNIKKNFFMTPFFHVKETIFQTQEEKEKRKKEKKKKKSL